MFFNVIKWFRNLNGMEILFMVKNNFVHRLTKVLIDIMFHGGILCCIAIPFIVPKLANFLNVTTYFGRRSEGTTVPFTIILLLSGLCAVYILWQLKAMFKTLLGGNPFTIKNVSCFRKCAVAGFLIAIIYTVKIAFWFTIASMIIVVIFALLGLFCLTLKDIFKQAVVYKEETDLTV